MSTLSTANITSKATNTPPVIKDVNGTECGTFCRAWINFNGTGTVAIRGSFNISSITDNGTGDYTLNFTNSMANGNYAVAGAARFSDYINSTVMRVVSLAGLGTLAQSMSTSSVRVSTNYSNGGIEDVQVVCVTVFGD